MYNTSISDIVAPTESPIGAPIIGTPGVSDSVVKNGGDDGSGKVGRHILH